MEKPKIIDAEFEVVTPPRDQPLEYDEPTGSVFWCPPGIPPDEWRRSTLKGKIIGTILYWVVGIGLMSAVYMAAHRLFYGTWLPYQ